MRHDRLQRRAKSELMHRQTADLKSALQFITSCKLPFAIKRISAVLVMYPILRARSMQAGTHHQAPTTSCPLLMSPQAPSCSSLPTRHAAIACSGSGERGRWCSCQNGRCVCGHHLGAENFIQLRCHEVYLSVIHCLCKRQQVCARGPVPQSLNSFELEPTLHFACSSFDMRTARSHA